MKKRCSKCKRIKTLDQFFANKNGKLGVHHYCKKCHVANRGEAHPSTKPKALENRYGIEFMVLLEMYYKQQGCCTICGDYKRYLAKRGGLVVDHNHKTGGVRGLICQACNTLLGVAKDNIKTLEAAIKYLSL